MTTKNTFDDAVAWLKEAEGKPPVVASRRTQARYNSEFQPIVIHKDDKEGLKKVLQAQKEFTERFSSTQKKK